MIPQNMVMLQAYINPSPYLLQMPRLFADKKGNYPQLAQITANSRKQIA